MSSIYQQEELQWGPSNSDRYKDENKLLAVQKLLDAGFYKMDMVLSPPDDDPSRQSLSIMNTTTSEVVAGTATRTRVAAWDLILAEKATAFSTCTKGCIVHDEVCSKCNHLGHFARFAMIRREAVNKTSQLCWPE